MSLNQALQLDAEDELNHFRNRFQLPNGKLYFCNNSLGLPAKSATIMMEKNLRKWSEEGAHAWFTNDDNWYSSFDKKIKRAIS